VGIDLDPGAAPTCPLGGQEDRARSGEGIED